MTGRLSGTPRKPTDPHGWPRFRAGQAEKGAAPKDRPKCPADAFQFTGRGLGVGLGGHLHDAGGERHLARHLRLAKLDSASCSGRDKLSSESDRVDLERPAPRTSEGETADCRPAFVGRKRHRPGPTLGAFHQHLLGRQLLHDHRTRDGPRRSSRLKPAQKEGRPHPTRGRPKSCA